MAAAVGETVWWVTLVDATLVRYHPRDYETALASKDVRRRKTEGTLEGLPYVRNQLGKSVEPDEFVRPAVGDDGPGGWAWRQLPEPGLDALAPRARQWELSRYRAYQGRLAGRDIARTFARCTEFLAQAASLVSGAPARTGDPQWPAGPPAIWPPPTQDSACTPSFDSSASPRRWPDSAAGCVAWRDGRRPRARAARHRARARSGNAGGGGQDGADTGPAAGDGALAWSVTAMTDALRRLAGATAADAPQAVAAATEAVWWFTAVDAAMSRRHPGEYRRALAALDPAARRAVEGSLAGLRFIHGQLGYSADPAEFIQPPTTPARPPGGLGPPSPRRPRSADPRGTSALTGSTGPSSPAGP